jgi:cyclase
VLGRTIEPAPKGALPVITFEDKLTVHLNGEDIRAIHFGKGHTDGDSIIYFTQSNVVHMGDDFVTYGFPFIDLESGGSVKGLIDSLHGVVPSLPADVKIIPGHGTVSSVEDVKKFMKMLEETYAIVEKGVKAGKSLGEMKKAKVLSAYESWSGDFVKTDGFLETVYNDITHQSTPGTPTTHH